MRDTIRVQGTIALFVFFFLNQVIYPQTSRLEEVMFHIANLDMDERRQIMTILQGQIMNHTLGAAAM